MALLVVLACCAASGEEPVVWYPAQQAPDSTQTQKASAPEGQQPAPAPAPTAEPAPAGEQPAPSPPGEAADPRVNQPLQPLDAATPVEQSGAQPAAAWVPDNTPLNTPQDLTLGRSLGGRSRIEPSIRVQQLVDATTGSTDYGTTPVTLLSGSAQLIQEWGRSHMTLNYGAGGTLFPDNWDRTTAFQQFGASLAFTLGRWDLRIADSGNYSPEASFGYYGFAGGAGSGAGGGLGAGYIPNQTILTPQAARISNTATTTLAYQLSARSNLHFSGSFGILRFQEGGFTNTTNGTYSAGYDRSFGANSVGISYNGSLYYYGGTDRSIQTNGASLSFGRRIAGRLALQLAGGGGVRQVDDPALGSDSHPSWNVRGSLTYQVGRLNLATSLSRDTGSGAGVFGGSESFVWQASAARSLGRTWAGSANFGIARNTALTVSGLEPERIVNSQFFGVQVSHPFSRETSLYFSYNFQHQTSNTPVCAGCGTSFNRHVGGIGFEWHSRPWLVGSL